MTLVRWHFAAAVGILGAVLEASSIALLEVSKAAAARMSALPYLLFVLAVPYLAITSRRQWWLSTSTTLALAWVVMLAASFPAFVIAGWIAASKGDTYFVVGHSLDYLLIAAPVGTAILVLLSFLLGGLARLLTRSPAA